jgi:hypothetical protein
MKDKVKPFNANDRQWNDICVKHIVNKNKLCNIFVVFLYCVYSQKAYGKKTLFLFFLKMISSQF